MDKRTTNRLMQFVAIAIGAWVVCRLVSRIDPRIVPLLCVLAGTNAATVWALQYGRVKLATLYGKPVLKQYVDVVCWLSRQQPPVESLVGDATNELLLVSREDFQDAAVRVGEVVRGHRGLISSLFDRLQQTILLRQRRADNRTIHPPLASILISGDEGIGKRYLCHTVAQALFKQSSILTFECDRLGSDPVTALFGGKDSPGQLIIAIKRQPYHIIVLERIDAAPNILFQHLLPVLQSGSYLDPSSGSRVVFQNCVFFFTTVKSVATLAALKSKSSTDRKWHQQAVEALSAETSLEFGFLNSLTDIFVCLEHTDLDKAEVVAMLMRREAEAYGITLTSVEPEIVVDLVADITPGVGFGALPDRIRKVMHVPLVEATEHNESQLRLIRRPKKQNKQHPHEQRIGPA